MYINCQTDLEALVQRLRKADFCAVDTEFLREKTYWPKLCLVQLASLDETALIDPLALDSLEPLAALLKDSSVVKVFHAGSQDIECLFHETGALPSPVFDTQIAAALLGHSHQIGYAALVSLECGVNLKKTDSFTDWSCRPLSTSQLDYAADDVIYLVSVYLSLKEKLEEAGRISWLEDDFADLIDPARYTIDPRERFRRLKRVSSLSRRQLACARELAAWRETEARRRNLPRRWILSDEQIIEACKREAASVSEIFMVRGMRERLSTKAAREVAALMLQALNEPAEQWPEIAHASRNEPNVDAQMDLMLALVHLRAKQNNVAAQNLASHDDLLAIARGHRKGIELLRGWRKAMVGEELLQLLEGRLCLRLEEGQLQVNAFKEG